MVMAGDGHSNIFNINSLEYPNGSLPDLGRINEAVKASVEHKGDYATCDQHAAKDSAFGKFDMIFTNPPFGSKVEVAQGIVGTTIRDSVLTNSERELYLCQQKESWVITSLCPMSIQRHGRVTRINARQTAISH